MTGRLSKILVLALVMAACNRGERQVAPGGLFSDAPAAADSGTVWIGIYTRLGDSKSFRVCRQRATYQVTANDSLLSLLDATVDFHAPRPTTTIFAGLRGDTASIPGDTSYAGMFTVTAIDSTRAPEGDECAPVRPANPPPVNEALLRRAVMRALGPDSSAARSWRSGSAWLNGDHRGDAVVLLSGDRFCAVRGCALLAFAGQPEGYALVSRTNEVVPPVAVRPEGTGGWRHISVQWNGGAFGRKLVLLKHGRAGYPPMASVQQQVRITGDSGRVLVR